MIKSRLQSNTRRAIFLLTCETHVESSVSNKIKEYMQENEMCCKLGSELRIPYISPAGNHAGTV